jgi:2,3-bisphosphoglycerate-dependent phosphoglycerate mutase
MVFELEDEMKPIRRYYLGDSEKAKKAMEGVASQAKGKK